MNKTTSTLTVWPATSATVNGTTADSINAGQVKTYWPFSGSPGGWISN